MIGRAPFFDRNTERWLLYTESVRGRLLHELAWHHLEPHLGPTGELIKALDAGCGLGDMAFRLLNRAERLVLLDFSEKMIEGAKKRLSGRCTATDRKRIAFVNGAVEELESCVSEGSFDLIVCHNTLEYTEEPEAALALLAKRLSPCGLLSIVVANRFSEPLKLALGRHDLAGARRALHARDWTADLFDHAPKRAFSFQELEDVVMGLDLKAAARHGIRIFTDYLPEDVVEDPGNFQLLLELEKEAASQPAYIPIARYLQVICRK